VTAHSSNASFIDALRLTDAQRQALFSNMEDWVGDYRGVELRDNDRLPYRSQAGLVLKLYHPGGSVIDYLVRPRNISRHGLGFLHGSYLHVDSRCQVNLRTKSGELLSMSGRVCRCRHVQGRVHEVGMRFDQPVDVSLFADNCVTVAEGDQASSELPKLRGRLLYVEDVKDEQELLEYHLKRLGVECRVVAHPQEAMRQLADHDFSLVMTAMELPGMSGAELAQAIRQAGYTGPIIATTADATEQVQQQALDGGCTAVLGRPYRFDQLVALLGDHLESADTVPETGDCMISEYWSDPQMRPMIVKYVGRLEDQMQTLRRWIDQDPTADALRKGVLDLKGTSGGYGFPKISEAADQLLHLLHDQAGEDQLLGQLDQLTALVQAAVRVRQEVSRSAKAAG
jgi:CheY-like chemotaxis protein